MHQLQKRLLKFSADKKMYSAGKDRKLLYESHIFSEKGHNLYTILSG